MSSTISIPLRRAALIGCLLATSTVPALASTTQASPRPVDKASQHTIYVAAKVHAQTAHGLIHLTGTSMLPAGDNNWMSRSDLLTDQITFEEMGQSTRQSVYAVGRVSVQQQGPFVQFSLTIRDLNKLPGVYRVKLSVAEPESVLVVRGLDPVAGACSFSSGQAGSLGSGGCTTVAANATR